ncbi:hypothetical protein GJ496_004195 [Pomphorhynchus laevis]|nr:hypothetical protein GJ496_004195 [Pomphorhynchus laevis]
MVPYVSINLSSLGSISILPLKCTVRVSNYQSFNSDEDVEQLKKQFKLFSIRQVLGKGGDPFPVAFAETDLDNGHLLTSSAINPFGCPPVLVL